ncbi:MAG: hypothetical protein AB7S26_04510 [Sandaracinaceae bacterium]
MSERRVHLEVVDVKNPCTEDWSRMKGDDVQRFCLTCHENVYDLSFMAKEDAERFLENAEGRVCIRLMRRADGTMVTRDCTPDRFAAARRAARRSLAFVGAGLASALGLVGALGFGSVADAGGWIGHAVRETLTDPEPIPMMGEYVDPTYLDPPLPEDPEAPADPTSDPDELPTVGS